MMDKKVENIKALQAELDRRTAVEKLAEKQVSSRKFFHIKMLKLQKDISVQKSIQKKPLICI